MMNDNEKPVYKILEDVCNDICNNFCKYSNTCNDDCECEWLQEGNACPLDRL